MAKSIKYTEPASYFPKSVRKANKIGEYAETKTDKKGKASATSKKK